jgi:hypothetical protein
MDLVQNALQEARHLPRSRHYSVVREKGVEAGYKPFLIMVAYQMLAEGKDLVAANEEAVRIAILKNARWRR